MGICCMAQETQTGALYQPRGVGCGGRWKGGSKGRVYMYTYGWFTLRFDRKQQNSVKQLPFNKKNRLKRKKKKKNPDLQSDIWRWEPLGGDFVMRTEPPRMGGRSWKDDPLPLHHLKSQQKGSFLWISLSPDMEPASTLVLNFAVSKTVRNQSLSSTSHLVCGIQL